MALAVLSLGGIFVGGRYLATARLNEKLEEAVGRDSGYTETILMIESEAASMTFAELFELCEKSVADRTTLIVDLRGLYPDIDSELRTALIEHLTAENELVRQKAGFYRKQMAVSTALELYMEHLADRPTSYYGWDYYQTRLAKLKSEASEAVTEMVTEGTQFITTYQALIDREGSLGDQMSSAGLRFVRVFQKYKSQNVEKAQDSIKTVQDLKI